MTAANRFRQKVGQVPGSLDYTGPLEADNLRITALTYDKNSFREVEIQGEAIEFAEDLAGVFWLDVQGMVPSVLKEIGKTFNLHPLLLEDILDMEHRPKIDDYGEYLYIVVKDIVHNPKTGRLEIEQVNLILGQNYLISIRGGTQDIFAPIKKRLRNGIGNVRTLGADYLAYALMDIVVDNYFVALEEIGEKIEWVQNLLIKDPEPEALDAINLLKRNMLYIRKSLWPLREIINYMNKEESKLVSEHTAVYLRDVYDHTIQVMETIETYRDMLSGMVDIYLSSVSNRTNEIMKVLTIISTIFIPLTFIVGLYGMNFRYMPELNWPWGYPAVWLVMLVITGSLVIYFRRKKWL